MTAGSTQDQTVKIRDLLSPSHNETVASPTMSIIYDDNLKARICSAGAKRHAFRNDKSEVSVATINANFLNDVTKA